jgi:hypothetical protein
MMHPIFYQFLFFQQLNDLEKYKKILDDLKDYEVTF